MQAITAVPIFPPQLVNGACSPSTTELGLRAQSLHTHRDAHRYIPLQQAYCWGQREEHPVRFLSQRNGALKERGGDSELDIRELGLARCCISEWPSTVQLYCSH